MKKITTIAFLILSAAFTAFTQNGKDEQEILKINQEYNGASLKNDLAFFERVLADDYIYSGPSGRLLNRTQYLEEIRNEAAKPTYKLQDITSVEPKIKMIGHMAILTAGWASATTPLNDTKTEPHKDTGRYTSVYEKRGGRWMITAEHVSEAPHDKKLMEQQLKNAGLAYNEMLKSNDVAAMEKVLAAEYMYTSSEGTFTSKEQEVARHKSGKLKFELAETTDQKVRIIGNGSAIETATFRAKGTNDGKPFDETERYTTVWVWRDGRWQIAADHASAIKR